ncbi:MAG: amidohydrolase family protein [Burkholderiales bacterium]|nr:amidohydrolase family protein [Burkholderiales bacterium]
MVRDDSRRGWEGRSVGALAAAEGRHPFDWLLDLALAENLQTVLTAVLLNSDDEQVARLLRHPNSIVSLSDAGAHVTFLCDAGFGLHLLGHWVRDKRLMPLAQAIRKLTSGQAKLFGIVDRGVIRPGAWADLLLFDPATVGRGESVRRFDLPGGSSRLHTPSRGVHGVWVNGVRIADADGLRADSGRPGRVLREFAS